MAEIEKLKKMSLQGFTPAEIGKDLGCAISTVHYHKDKFRREEGIRFPVVKGKRPSDTPSAEPKRIPASSHVPIRRPLKLIVNGVSIKIAPCIKSIEIEDNTVQINF